ncbi:MAG: hypothetical protein JSR80_01150 [Verrucomicrobia bacterium]|nr:hypothetical protein [Verrucomicrobiota bacterium]
MINPRKIAFFSSFAITSMFSCVKITFGGSTSDKRIVEQAFSNANSKAKTLEEKIVFFNEGIISMQKKEIKFYGIEEESFIKQTRSERRKSY